jgi:rhamnogalacturonyl hydrolase YesR
MVRRMKRCALAGFLVFLGLLAGCRQDFVPAFPVELQLFYQTVQRDAQRFLQHDGEWEQHYGDAPFYATAFYVRAGQSQQRADFGALAAASKRHSLAVLRQARKDRAFLLSNLEEVMMAGLGLIEYAAQTGERDTLADLDELIEVLNAVTIGLGRYIDFEAGQFAIRTYGPTAITAAVALLNLQYAQLLRTELTADRLEMARSLVATIDKKARDGQRYRVRPGDDQLELYPNTMMMLVLTRLYAVTGERSYLQTAEGIFEAIQPLRNQQRGGYNSPYSAQAMGAKTDDYSTLSSQNYLSLALLTMYEQTQDPRYFEEAVFVLQFVRQRLYDPAQGRLLHHFIDGRMALPSDPEYFCTGCNLQFLYVMWYGLHQALGTP